MAESNYRRLVLLGLLLCGLAPAAAALADAAAPAIEPALWRVAQLSFVTPLSNVFDRLVATACVDASNLAVQDPLAHAAVSGMQAQMCGQCFEVVGMPVGNSSAAAAHNRRLLSAAAASPAPVAPFDRLVVRVSSTFACAHNASGDAKALGAGGMKAANQRGMQGCGQGAVLFKVPAPDTATASAPFQPAYPVMYRATPCQLPAAAGPADPEAAATRQEQQGPIGGARRRLAQNPDLPQQRDSKPAWLNGGNNGGSSSNGGRNSNSGNNGGGSSNGGGAQAQPQPQPQPQQAAATQPQGTEDLSSLIAQLAQGDQGQGQGQQQQQQERAAPSAVSIFSGGAYGSSWEDQSYGQRALTSRTSPGRSGGAAHCAFLPHGAAAVFHSKGQGAFEGQKALEFWAFVGPQGASALPDLRVYVADDQGTTCPSTQLRSLSPAEQQAGWARFWLPLSGSSQAPFAGCAPASSPSGSSWLPGAQAARVELRNDNRGYDALICLDQLRLTP